MLATLDGINYLDCLADGEHSFRKFMKFHYQHCALSLSTGDLLLLAMQNSKSVKHHMASLIDQRMLFCSPD